MAETFAAGADTSTGTPTPTPTSISTMPSVSVLATCLQTPSEPVAKRMRAIYYLRVLGSGKSLLVPPATGATPTATTFANPTTSSTSTAIAVLAAALLNQNNSQLVRHELAYVLGQLQNPAACDVLELVLDDPFENVMVRHECAEALGAIGAERSIPVLQRSSGANNTNSNGHVATTAVPETPVEVCETCAIALDLIKWKVNGRQGEAPLHCACMSPYSSVDPAPPHPTDDLPTEALEHQLRDESLGLFKRYRAMFSLRNRGTDDAVAALGRALVSDTSSVLFRHEVAYVLGQTQSSVGLEALAESLARNEEHEMVRHEAAEALGTCAFRFVAAFYGVVLYCIVLSYPVLSCPVLCSGIVSFQWREVERLCIVLMQLLGWC